MRTTTLATVIFTGLFFLATTAYAEDVPNDGDAILAKVDRVATQAEDFTARVELETTEANGKKTRRTFEVWQKGENRRMVKLTKPARLRGVGILATGPNEFHMYLPSFGRIRRVAGQKRGEPFLGSNFTRDDMVRTGYSSRFKAKLVGQDDESWKLRLDPKKPADEPYHHLLLEVRKSDTLVAKVEFFEKDGPKPSRRLVASDFRTVGSVPIAGKFVATNLEDGSRSEAVMHDVKIDTGLSDSFFSRRYLKRSR